MRNYAQYREALDALLTQLKCGRSAVSSCDIRAHLNGKASEQLRALVSRTQIRRSGAFFTSDLLGKKLVDAVTSTTRHVACAAWDPTCGAGDLLLKWSQRLPTFPELSVTLAHWGQYLHGNDIHKEFVAVAKRRIALAAIERGCSMTSGQDVDIDKLLPNLRVQRFQKSAPAVPGTAVILMNPPFILVSTPKECRDWSTGKVSFAAVALFTCLSNAKPGQRICAILPDVLRSGSRYNSWRKVIENLVSEADISLLGKFDVHADVDVFLFNAIVGESEEPPIPWQGVSPTSSSRTLEDLCEIKVGTVVPHRLKSEGKKRYFLNSAIARPGKIIKKLDVVITFAGNTTRGPFVALRRTSSPSDQCRLVSAIVATAKDVAVENHLITLRPYDRKIETCRLIMNHLETSEARKWIDGRIRCRHLTVSAVKQIPVPDAI